MEATTLLNFPHILDPDEARIATAAGFGSFVFLMITRNLGWLYVVTLFGVGQVTAYYFTVPIALWRGWTPSSYGVIGFTIGAFGMLLWGAVIKLAQNLHDDPRGTVSWAWRLWKGNSYGSSNPNDEDRGAVP